jgi:hypothetical protein
MHDPSCEGNDFFKCDFCRRGWSEDRPMVEGHRGSLICTRCLTSAYIDVVHNAQGDNLRKTKCAMCLNEADEPQWQSPMFEESHICRRCIKQSTVMFERDPESNWKRPEKPGIATKEPGAQATDG